MSLLSIPYLLFQPNTTISASQVTANFNAIKTWAQSIDDLNISSGGITLSSKGKAGSINASLMGTGAIRNAAMDYTSANLGVRAIRFASGSYPGTGGAVAIRCRKSVTVANNANNQEVTISFITDSIDGPVTFSASPIVVFSWEEGANPEALDQSLVYFKLKKDSVTTTEAKVMFKGSGALAGGQAWLHLIAIGGVA